MATTFLSGSPVFDPANRIGRKAPVLNQRDGVLRKTERVNDTRLLRQSGYQIVDTTTAIFSVPLPVVRCIHAHSVSYLLCPIAP